MASICNARPRSALDMAMTNHQVRNSKTVNDGLKVMPKRWNDIPTRPGACVCYNNKLTRGGRRTVWSVHTPREAARAKEHLRAH